ncbi:ABC transporter ATP-binding protein [Sphingobacterium psychroaquaticum]|uniref:Putative ABC transport system ATP-binding protein n=1 Tax=Sphingobacterium psychroaquaticum TaxID=561061 RepID=A0A1X7J4J7_9SPHI|nr:ABC transporter ATP-binding protein [Sphingobacterium psychroaquaticum]QBQ40111.1 ABC transporter ATP-binding protein [Sphingobacterium psychroaquaticum]SMG22262.1 putative ABC transport system ATP-binding protein [Sphingobacterium psychroaquaticum]
MIKITNLQKYYRTEEVETIALDNVNIHVKPGEFVAVMGPSGCGKSTLLNIVGLLDDLDEGSYLFNDIEVAKYKEGKRSDLRKHNIGFVFQSFNLIDELTVFENVELPLVYTNVPAAERKRRVEEVLEKVQIMHRRNHFPQQLSGGQQQRVAVARAVVNNPKLILADEPTGNLDSSNGNEVMQLLSELNEGGTTIVMVTHSEHDAKFADRVIRMLDGQVIMKSESL